MANDVKVDSLSIEISAGVNEAIKSIDELTSKLDNITNSISKGNSSISKISNDIKKQSNDISKSFNNIFKGLTTVFSGAVFSGIVNNLDAITSKSFDYIKSLRTTNLLMSEQSRNIREITGDIHEYADGVKTYAQASTEYAEEVERIMGIDIAEWLDSQTTIFNMGKGFGMASDQAYILSKNLTQLAYDMSALKGIDVNETMSALQGGISGSSTKTLRKQFGISLTDTDLKSYAMANGIIKEVSAMTQAEKSILRYNILMEKTTNIQGYMSKSLDSPITQLRILKTQLDIFIRTLQTILVPLLNAIIPILTTIVEVAKDFAQTIASLMGFDIKFFDASDYQDALTASGGIGDNLEDAEKTSKKLKKNLEGYDEINLINNDIANTTDGLDIGTSNLGIDLKTYDFLGDATEKAKELKSLFEAILKIVLAIATAIKVLPIASKIAEAIRDLGGLKNAIWYVFDEAMLGLDKILTKFGFIKGAMGWSFIIYLSFEAGKMIKEGFEDFNIKNTQEEIKEAYAYDPKMGKIMESRNRRIDRTGKEGQDNLWFEDLSDAFEQFKLDWLDFVNEGKLIIEEIGQTEWGGAFIKWASDWKKGFAEDLPKAFNEVKISIIEKFNELKLKIVEVFNNFIEWLQGIWNSIKEFAKNPIGFIFGGKQDLTGELDYKITNNAERLEEQGGIKETFEKIGTDTTSFIEEKKEGILDFISGIFGDRTSFVEDEQKGIEDFIGNKNSGLLGTADKTIKETVKNGIETPIIGDNYSVKTEMNKSAGLFSQLADKVKGVITYAKNAIESARSSSDDEDDGGSYTSSGTIYAHASGGFPKGDLFLANERGAEMVGSINNRPSVANNQQIVDGIRNGVANANVDVIATLETLIQVLQDKNMVVNISDNEIGMANDRYNNTRGIRVSKGVFANQY